MAHPLLQPRFLQLAKDIEAMLAKGGPLTLSYAQKSDMRDFVALAKKHGEQIPPNVAAALKRVLG
jgi:hypothetical protein